MPLDDLNSKSRVRLRNKGRTEVDNFRYARRSNQGLIRRKSLSKNRIYLPPSDWYKYKPDYHRDMTSSFQGTYHRSLNEPMELQRRDGGRKIIYDKIFTDNRRMSRKAMVIGERRSLWNMTEPRRAELPGDLFVDNLRHKHMDWRQYDNVTWNDILESHQKDVYSYREIAQTLPQKEAWLASIDDRVRYSKMHSNRGLPHISPRLFNNKVVPQKHPVNTRYLTKDKTGNIFYLVGPTDVTKPEYRYHVLPEIVRPVATPKRLNF